MSSAIDAFAKCLPASASSSSTARAQECDEQQAAGGAAVHRGRASAHSHERTAILQWRFCAESSPRQDGKGCERGASRSLYKKPKTRHVTNAAHPS
eukprot:3369166-Prymnesium_polylepis.2